jgi:hypothetical protein
VLQEESENIEDFDAEMVALECTYDGCTAGEGGAKFKTPAFAPAQAVEYLRFHREDAHGQRGAAAGGGADEVQLSRPEISGGCSQEDFKFFTRKWDQYVRSSNEKDGNKLKDQLENCPDDTLRSALYKALGDRINTINVMAVERDGAGGGNNKSRLAKMPSTKFQSSDGHIFHVERDIARQYVTLIFARNIIISVKIEFSLRLTGHIHFLTD